MGPCNLGQGPALPPVTPSPARPALLSPASPRSGAQGPPLQDSPSVSVAIQSISLQKTHKHAASSSEAEQRLHHHPEDPSWPAGRAPSPAPPGSPSTRGLCAGGDSPTAGMSSAGTAREGLRTAVRQQSLENNYRSSVYAHFCFQLFSSAYSAGALYVGFGFFFLFLLYSWSLGEVLVGAVFQYQPLLRQDRKSVV